MANVGIANPASVHCEAQGGTVQVIDTPEGQMGICRFPDGSYCEEFAFLRGECHPRTSPSSGYSSFLSSGYSSSWWKYIAVGVVGVVVGVLVGRRW